MAAANREEAETEISTPDKSWPRCMLSVLEIVPVGRTTLYRLEKAGRFPRSTYISPNRRVWFGAGMRRKSSCRVPQNDQN